MTAAEPVAVTLLRFLASPRRFQRDYVPLVGARVYGCELRESYVECPGGLELLLRVGADAVYWPDFRARTSAQAEETLLRLYGTLKIIIDWGGARLLSQLIANLDDVDDDSAPNNSWSAGVWRLLQQLAAQALQELGLPVSPPDLSFEEAFLTACQEV